MATFDEVIHLLCCGYYRWQDWVYRQLTCFDFLIEHFIGFRDIAYSRIAIYHSYAIYRFEVFLTEIDTEGHVFACSCSYDIYRIRNSSSG